jgi:hypothetical protein
VTGPRAVPLDPAEIAALEASLAEFVRTYVTFRPVKCETVGHSLRWTFAPVIHDKPVPPEDMSIYNTGSGVEPKRGTWGGAVSGGPDA